MNPAPEICEGQTDLMDLVEVEHICGSMPAGERELQIVREQFYARLRAAKGTP